MNDYFTLPEYCTSKEELMIVEACLEHGSPAKAAPHLGKGERCIRRKLEVIRDRVPKMAADVIPKLYEAIPSPQIVKGTSTMFNLETGMATRSWVKTDVDKTEQLKQVIDAATSAIEAYNPIPKIKAPKTSSKDILTVYPLGDPHIGMRAWASEVGEHFDCDIAEANLRKAMQYLVDKAPDSETAIILNLGDFFHSDSSSNTTTKGTPVDVDGRWARVLEIGITLMIDCVHMALGKHKKVIVKNNIGNHDSHTSQVLSICMRHAFKNNPRVEIANPADKFFMYEFGKCMIFSTHGDGLKPKQAQGFVSNAYSEVWGRTEHRFALFGHFHHEQTLEEHGLITRIFNTLASSDAWHHASGYRSKRNMKCLVLHKTDGLQEEYTFNLSRKMLETHNDKASQD